MPSSKHGMAIAVMNTKVATVPGTRFTPDCWPEPQQSAIDVIGIHRALCLTAELLATDRFLKEGFIVFSCVPTGEPTGLQWIVPNP